MKPVHALRWLALVVGCPVLWVGLLMATIVAYDRIEQDLCPSAALMSGICNDRLTGWALWLLRRPPSHGLARLRAAEERAETGKEPCRAGNAD
jgi:hypothetical protein